MRQLLFLIVIFLTGNLTTSAQSNNLISRIVNSNSFDPGIENIRMVTSSDAIYIGGNFDNLLYYAEGKTLAPKEGKSMFLIKYDQDLGVQNAVSINAVFKDFVCLGDNLVILADFRDSCVIGDTIIYSNRPSQDHTGFFVSLNSDLETVRWIDQNYFEKASADIYFLGNFNLKSDLESNVYVSGIFTDSLYLGDTLLHCTKYQDKYPLKNVFIGKFSKDGLFSWGKVLAGDGGNFVVDGDMNMHIIDSRDDTYYSKYNEHGDTLFSRVIATEDFSAASMRCDSKNNIYISLFVKRSTSIDGINFQMIGSWDNAIMKYDPEGNLKWLSQIGRPYTYMPPSQLEVDNQDNLYSLGSNMKDNVTFANSVYSAQSEAFYLAGWNEDGSVKWIEISENATGTEEGIDLSVYGNKAFYLFNAVNNGNFLNTSFSPVFNPEIYLGSVTLLDATGISNPYSSNYKEIVTIFPNPILDKITIEMRKNGEYTIDIASLNGQQIYSTKVESTSYNLDISSFHGGIYFITIRSKDFVITQKIIKL